MVIRQKITVFSSSLAVPEFFYKFNIIRENDAFFARDNVADLCIRQLHAANDFQLAFHMVGEDPLFEWLEYFEVPAQKRPLFL